MIVIEFACIGFDIRVALQDLVKSADATVWPQEESLYEQALSGLKIHENGFELLMPASDHEMTRLIDLVEASSNALLVALRLPAAVLKYCKASTGDVPDLDLSKYKFDFLAFDVCDIDGLFSYEAMTAKSGDHIRTYDSSELLDASLCTQIANLRVPDHAPFVVVEVISVRRAIRNERSTGCQ